MFNKLKTYFKNKYSEYKVFFQDPTHDMLIELNDLFERNPDADKKCKLAAATKMLKDGREFDIVSATFGREIAEEAKATLIKP